MKINKISDISKYTVALYRERYKLPCHIGSAILISFCDKYYLVSAFHVFDMEDERIKIENDPEEKNISQDDFESIMAKGKDGYFYVYDFVKGLVCTVHYDIKTSQPVFNDDLEWCICELPENRVQYFIEYGKSIFEIINKPSSVINVGNEIVISGFPGYAQKDNQEVFRSFKGKLLDRENVSQSGLFRVQFDNANAFNYEMNKNVQIPRIEGISGMSGGGLWYKTTDDYIPLGIILKQDPNYNYVEGVYIDEILKSI